MVVKIVLRVYEQQGDSEEQKEKCEKNSEKVKYFSGQRPEISVEAESTFVWATRTPVISLSGGYRTAVTRIMLHIFKDILGISSIFYFGNCTHFGAELLYFGLKLPRFIDALPFYQ